MNIIIHYQVWVSKFKFAASMVPIGRDLNICPTLIIFHQAVRHDQNWFSSVFIPASLNIFKYNMLVFGKYIAVIDTKACLVAC